MKTVNILAALAVSASLVAPTFAADAPLPAGRPAGTKQAALLTASFPLILVGLAATFAIIGASGGFNTSKSNATTGTGS